jgi:hypothetical protein
VVLVARRVVLVGPLLHDPVLDQAVEALLEDVPGDPELLLHLFETVPALESEQIADDEQRPPLAHDFERLGDGAVEVCEALPAHGATIARVPIS